MKGLTGTWQRFRRGDWSAPVSVRRALVGTLALGLGGWALNGLPTEASSGVHFVWGGVLYLLAALAYGPLWGFGAAAVAGSATVALWGNPYGWVVFAFEGLAVGLLARGRQALVADLLYWGIVGVPLTALAAFFLMDLPPTLAWVIVVKGPVNGLSAVIGADLLLRVGVVRRALGLRGVPDRPRPLRSTLANVLSLAMVVPLVVFGLTFGEVTVSHLERDAVRRIRNEARALTRELADRLKTHRDAVVALAAAVEHKADFSEEALNRWLSEWRMAYPTFRTLLAAEADGRVAGAAPAVNAAGDRLLGQGVAVADRDYFVRPLATGKPFISGVFLGRAFGEDPIVAISAPVKRGDGRWWGIVEGSLDLPGLGSRPAPVSHGGQAHVVVVDQRERVIVSDEPDRHPVLREVADTPLVRASKGRGEDTPFAFGGPAGSGANEPRYIGVRNSVRVEGMDGPWQVFTYIDSREILADVEAYSALVLGGTLVLFGLAGFLAHEGAKRVTRPLEDLVRSIRGLAFEPRTEPPTFPERGEPAEVVELLRSFESMTGQIRSSYSLLRGAVEERDVLNRRLQELVGELERRVEERTADVRESGQLLATAQAFGRVGSWVAETAGPGRLTWSDETCRIFGLAPDEFDGDPETFFRLVHPDDRARVRGEGEESTAQARASEIEYRIQRRDGEVRWIYQRAEVEVRDDGSPGRKIGVVQDITDRKRAEEALKKSESLLAATLESTADGILVVDSAGRVASYNHGFLAMWRIPEALAASRDDEALLRFVLQQVQDPGAFLAKIQELYRTPEASSWDEILFRDGRVFERYSQPQRLGERIAGRVWSFRNVTERKRSEAALRRSERRFRELVENQAEGVWEVDAEGRFTFLNPAGEGILGVGKDGVIGRRLEEFAVGSKALASPPPPGGRPGPERFEVEVARADGRRSWIDVSSSPRHGEDGAYLGALGVFRDVTERKRAEEQRRELEARLRQAQKMEAVGHLAGGVAHDFNNILAALIMNIDLLLSGGDLPKEARESLAEMLELSERAAALTRQLLLFARRGVMRPSVLDLNVLVSDLLKMLGRLIGERIRLTFVPDAAPVGVRADAGMIGQVVTNLVVNARDAIAKSGRIELTVRRARVSGGQVARHPAAREGEFACIEVSDTGCGMDGATRERIFEPFFTTKEVGKGSGLGLSTVQGIVEQHHGWIEVESDLGQGSTFRVFLPVAELAVQETAKRGEAPPTPGGRRAILVVEDEGSVRQTIVRALERDGHRVVAAGNGEEAWRRWQSDGGRFDLVLTDIVMPEGLDGLDLVERLRQERPALPVVFMTGHSAELLGREFGARPGTRLLQKPFTKDQLLSAVRLVLDPPA